LEKRNQNTCETFYGMYLQPYWIVIVSTIVFILLSELLNWVTRLYEDKCLPPPPPNGGQQLAKQINDRAKTLDLAIASTQAQVQGSDSPTPDPSLQQNQSAESSPDSNGPQPDPVAPNSPAIALPNYKKNWRRPSASAYADRAGGLGAHIADIQREEWDNYMEQRFLTSNRFLLIFSVLLQFVLFIHVCATGQATTSWDRYEEIYCTFLNSGMPGTYIAFLLTFGAGAEDEDVTERLGGKITFNIIRYLFFLDTALLLPPLITHIIPMIVIYCWVVVIGIIVLGLLYIGMYMAIPRIGKSLCGWEKNASMVLQGIFMIKFASLFVVTILFQTFINYGAIFYSGHNYVDTIADEFNLRSTSCYLQNVVSDVQSGLRFFSLV